MSLIIAFALGALIALVYAATRHDAVVQEERQRMMRSCRLVTMRLEADGGGADVTVARMLCVN